MPKKPAQKKSVSKVVKTESMRWSIPFVAVFFVVAFIWFGYYFSQKQSSKAPVVPEPTPVVSANPNIIPLPSPDLKSTHSVEAVLKSRRSQRNILNNQLSLKQISQMLWAAQGVTSDWGGRTAPSAKSTYPLTLYLIANNVKGLENGVYRYIPGDRLPAHQLIPLKHGDFKDAIFNAANQASLKEAASVFVVTGNMSKMANAFGGVAHDSEVYLEAGHAAQNMYLETESLGLGMVTVSGFDGAKVKPILGLPAEDTIIYLVPFGYPKQ